MKIRYEVKDILKMGDWVEVIKVPKGFDRPKCLGFKFQLPLNPKKYTLRDPIRFFSNTPNCCVP